MAHIRKQIRDVFETRLTGLSYDIGAGAVSIGLETERFHAIPKDNLPLNRVAWKSDQILDRSQDDERRRLIVEVEAWASGEPLQDKLDAMAVEIETAICVDLNLGGLVQACRLEATDFMASADGEQRTGLATISFRVDVVTSAGKPQTRT